MIARFKMHYSFRRWKDPKAAEKAEGLEKQYPGFQITCLKCGSTEIELDNWMGWSEVSGNFGSLELQCTKCGYNVAIAGDRV